MKQIIAMGGGGFLGNDETSVLDLYILAQSKKENPKICFLPTASADSYGVIKAFMSTFDRYPCQPSYISLFSLPTWDIYEHLLKQDIIYVGGGNTRSMLGLWKEWGIDKVLKDAYHKGTLLAGMSAGAVCWFNDFISDCFPGQYMRLEGLDLLPHSFAPHYSAQLGRRENFLSHIEKKIIKSGYGVDDYAAIHFKNGKFLRCISERKNARVAYVSTNGEQILEEFHKPDYLNDRDKDYLDKYIFSSPTFQYLKEEEQE